MLKNYHEVLELAKKADCFSYFRDSKSISLILDDKLADRRTCVEVSLKYHRVKIKTLKGYSAQSNMWGEYCAPQGTIQLENKQGLKALMEWIRGEATKETGYPNPVSVHFYKK